MSILKNNPKNNHTLRRVEPEMGRGPLKADSFRGKKEVRVNKTQRKGLHPSIKARSTAILTVKSNPLRVKHNPRVKEEVIYGLYGGSPSRSHRRQAPGSRSWHRHGFPRQGAQPLRGLGDDRRATSTVTAKRKMDAEAKLNRLLARAAEGMPVADSKTMTVAQAVALFNELLPARTSSW